MLIASANEMECTVQLSNRDRTTFDRNRRERRPAIALRIVRVRIRNGIAILGLESAERIELAARGNDSDMVQPLRKDAQVRQPFVATVYASTSEPSTSAWPLASRTFGEGPAGT
jgi:hypothetical protein